MNKLIIGVCVLSLFSCHPVFATPHRNCKPFYIGGELGGCNLHYDHSDLAHVVQSVDDTGFAGRLFAGFDINQNIGLELGYILYQNPEFKTRNKTADFSQKSVDFLAKASIPISCNVGVFAKGGLAYVFRDDAQIETDTYIIKINKADTHLRPMLGVGISYGFNSQVSGSLGYYRTFGTDNLEDADFYGAGITVRVG